MSLSTQTKIRLPTIKQGLREGFNYEQIGSKCGVTEKTIDRDMGDWVESGQFEIWLKTEFVELHNYTRKANPIEAYKQLSKIVGRMVTQKSEIKAEINSNITEVKVLIVDNSTNPIQPTSETDGNLQGQT